LTRSEIVIAVGVNPFGAKKTGEKAVFYPMWYSGMDALPYLAVNKLEQGASRRFGRDSFQTRSTP
jgi:hypothetical protein